MKKIYYLIIAIVAGICGCQPESADSGLAENQSPLEILQANFTLDTMDDPVGILKGNLNVVWSSYKVYPFEAVTWYEFSVQQLVKKMQRMELGKQTRSRSLHLWIAVVNLITIFHGSCLTMSPVIRLSILI